MAKCINKIINEDVSSAGIRNATDKNVYDRSNKGDIKLADSFLDTIETATLKLRRTNCSQVVLDYFSSKLPATAGATRKGYDWASEHSALGAGMSALGGTLDNLGIDSDSIISTFCVTVTNAFRTIEYYVDVATKAAFVIFKKIEKLKQKIEKALADFTNEVRDCMVSVIVDAKVSINKVVNSLLDFDSLIDLMDNCSCITDIVASMFDCKKDKNGNILTTPQEIVQCVIDKYSLNPNDILGAVNNFVDNTITGNINKGFNMLDKLIKNTMELLILPLRELMKAYCLLLNEKINVTSIIKSLGSSECLMIYTTERDDAGKEFLGMSVIDMVNTFKYWANCFEYACQDFVEDLSIKIKELNENLKLDDKYWRDTMLIDLYQSCAAVRVQAQQPRPSMVRELFVKNAGKGKDIFIDIIDAFKQTGKIDTSKEPATKNVTPISDAIMFKDGPDTENLPIQQGSLNYNASVEDNIINILRNIGTSVDQGIYFERFLQLIEWEGKFIKNNVHIKLIEEVDKKTKTSNTTREVSTAFDDSDTVRAGNAYDIEQNPPIQSFAAPTYQLDDDYDKESIQNIENSIVPNKTIGESLESYYARWFTEVI